MRDLSVDERRTEAASDRRLAARIVAQSALSDRTRAAMCRLYLSYYEATSPVRFEQDLATKDEVLLLHDARHVLRGFSTLKRYVCDGEAGACRVLFSGDTVVQHDFWGDQTLAFNWIRRAGAIKAEYPHEPLFWLLIVKGHRTFRYLQAFSREYFPHWQRSTPPAAQAVMDRFGQRLFGEAYDPANGIIRFAESHGQLRPEWAEPTPEAAGRPEVRFFLERNPGYRRGDELLCLTELSPENLRPLARRLFLAGMRE